MIDKNKSRTITFQLGNMFFEYDEWKNEYKIGNINAFLGEVTDILFVVYTERIQTNQHGEKVDVTRLISARQATNFERGLYYGKYQ